MTLLAIDPGTNTTGWAVFKRNHLFACGIGRKGEESDLAHKVDMIMQDIKFEGKVTTFVGEWPFIYPYSGQKGSPNDLVPLAYVLGRIEQKFNPTYTYLVTPRQWKGNVSKKIHHARIKKRLTPEESEIIRNSRITHDAWDAIGLGMWKLGRMENAS